mmetsp:Transcript_49875/g.100149  ORF Transcript_49875/g.100149 Transcript_49875/m.100149 type:complete len:150 (+) Transcript_49875:15-464(+)
MGQAESAMCCGTAARREAPERRPDVEPKSTWLKPPVKPDLERHFGPGVTWLVRSDKLVATGFPVGSVAKKLGVAQGDILKAVDGLDCLHLQGSPEMGEHPVLDLLRGSYGTHCKLTVLRVSEAAGEQPQLTEVDIVVPRIIPLPTPKPQ